MSLETLTILQESAPLLLAGAATTLRVWLYAVLVGLSVGIAWGTVSSNRLWIPYLSPVISWTAFVFRGIPFYVQLLIFYFILPDLINAAPSPFTIGALSLGLCSAAYICQITRSGINAIPATQWEAAHALGYSTWQTVRYIIIPQTLKIIVPPLAGECDQLLKSTSILATIGFLELTRMGMNIIAREMVPLPIYGAIALLYLAMSSALSLATRQAEKYFS